LTGVALAAAPDPVADGVTAEDGESEGFPAVDPVVATIVGDGEPEPVDDEPADDEEPAWHPATVSATVTTPLMALSPRLAGCLIILMKVILS
jgi:hypothetical protein